jgi:hypothetical protein
MFLVYSRDDALLSIDEKDASRLINSNKYILFAVQRAKGKRRCDLGCSVSPFSSLYCCVAPMHTTCIQHALGARQTRQPMAGGAYRDIIRGQHTGQDRIECRGYSADCRVQGRDRIPTVPHSRRCRITSPICTRHLPQREFCPTPTYE